MLMGNIVKKQAMAFPFVIEGNSCIIADQSGSGKTLAYLAPIIQRLRQEELQELSKTSSQSPRVVIIVPTAELASQVRCYCAQNHISVLLCCIIFAFLIFVSYLVFVCFLISAHCCLVASDQPFHGFFPFLQFVWPCLWWKKDALHHVA